MYNYSGKIFSIYFAIRLIILHLCMSKQKQKGGRKPVKPAEKVILVGFYVQKKYVDACGGMTKTRDLAKKHIEHTGFQSPKF